METAVSDAQGNGREQDRIAVAVVTLQTDLARTESKANLLLALAAAGLVGVVSAAANLHMSVAVVVAGSAGAAALLAATVLLLLAVRPVLVGGGWTNWSADSAQELRDRLVTGYDVGHLQFMAGLAMRKFRLIRAAVDCLLAGVVLLALAAVLVAAV